MSRNLISIFICIVLINSINVFANEKAESLIRDYDLRIYNPVKFGLKDIVFEMESDVINKQIKSRIVTSKVNNIKFKFYWMFPGRLSVEIIGMPRTGYQRIKDELKLYAAKRFDFVIPEPLKRQMRSYNLKITSSTKSRINIVANDLTNKKPINKINLTFLTDGRLTKIETSSPSGYESFEKDIKEKPWSHNKWVLNKLKLTSITGLKRVETVYKIDYQKVAGFGFVKDIMIESTSQMQYAGKNNSIESVEVLEFRNFKVNQGIARNYFRQNEKAISGER